MDQTLIAHLGRRKPLIAAILLAFLLPSATHAQAGPSQPVGQYYLALGDSLAYGVTAPGVPNDPTCTSSRAPGYVCVVFGYLRGINRAVSLMNLSATDIDSCVMVHGFGSGSPCVNRPGPGDLAAPLATAVDFIHAHPNAVGPVTVNVGGADLIPLLPAALTDPLGTAAKLPGVLSAYATNLDTILSTLRSAMGANGEIILVNQYNPLGGIGSPPLPSGLPAIAQGAIGQLNAIMSRAATKYSARLADVSAAFDAHPNGAAVLTFVPTSLASGDPSKIDIYPVAEGYRLMGQTVLKVSGYRYAAGLQLHLKSTRPHRGKTDKLTGTGASGASIKITIKLPHARGRSVSRTADNNGSFSVTFQVGKRPGSGSTRVCAADEITASTTCHTEKLRIR